MSDIEHDIMGILGAANASYAAGRKAASDDFNAGVRASDDAANLCSRKLRIALKALQIIAMPAPAANLESELERAIKRILAKPLPLILADEPR